MTMGHPSAWELGVGPTTTHGKNPILLQKVTKSLGTEEILLINYLSDKK
jgi:hypothetical protein